LVDILIAEQSVRRYKMSHRRWMES